MSGNEYGVNPQTLKQAARGIDAAFDELKKVTDASEATIGTGFSDLALTPNAAGNNELADTFEEFAERWAWEVQNLLQEGTNVAEKLGMSAGRYHEMEEYASGVVKDAAVSFAGDPTISSEQAARMDWGEIGDHAKGSFTPDYSAESAAEAHQQSVRMLQDTKQDLATEGVVGSGVTGHRKTWEQLTGDDESAKGDR